MGQQQGCSSIRGALSCLLRERGVRSARAAHAPCPLDPGSVAAAPTPECTPDALCDPAASKVRIQDIFRSVGTGAEAWSLRGLRGWARVLDVHDGDTCRCILLVPGQGFRKVTLRLNGIDAPEINSALPLERQLADAARRRVLAMLVPDEVLHPGFADMDARAQARMLGEHPVLAWVCCHGLDKYGRVLADVHSSPVAPSVSAVLVAEGLALPYDGGRKQGFSPPMAEAQQRPRAYTSPGEYWNT